MKKLKIAILFIGIIFSSCSTLKRQSIEIIGVAANLKAGAVVISKEDEKMYYLEGIPSWKQEMVGKVIKVSGFLKVVTRERDTVVYKQQIVGEKRTLLKPKWKLNK